MNFDEYAMNTFIHVASRHENLHTSHAHKRLGERTSSSV